MIIALENFPWCILYRAAVGYCSALIYFRWAAGGEAIWKMLVIFLAVLVALRVAPGIVRRALPFSSEAKTIWAQRRELAKRHDSYQWRKLFGIGLGWLAGVLMSQRTQSPAALVLAIGCLLAGALGMIFWAQRRRTIPDSVTATPAA